MMNINEETVESNLGAEDDASGASFKEDYDEKSAMEEEHHSDGSK